MIRKKRVVQTDSGPMADIAFLLIVFFLITSTMESKLGLGLTLPEKGARPVNISPKNMVQIYLNNDRFLLGNNEIAKFELPKLLKGAFELNNALVLTINSTRETNYENYLYVLDEARHAGITKISVLGSEM